MNDHLKKVLSNFFRMPIFTFGNDSIFKPKENNSIIDAAPPFVRRLGKTSALTIFKIKIVNKLMKPFP